MQIDAINIGPRERCKRLILGLVALTIGVSFAFVLIVFQAPRWPRIIVFFPFWIAGLGLLQVREKTCIALAAKGTCNMDSGEVKIEDAATVKTLKIKARHINRRALITALAATIVTILFP